MVGVLAGQPVVTAEGAHTLQQLVTGVMEDARDLAAGAGEALREDGVTSSKIRNESIHGPPSTCVTRHKTSPQPIRIGYLCGLFFHTPLNLKKHSKRENRSHG